jgi:hypothetical protein
VNNTPLSALAGWTPSQIEDGRRWVEDWRRAGDALERIRRAELRSLDRRRAIELLCGSHAVPRIQRTPRSSSGLVEQQRWFMRAAKCE